jgi:F-type H+-transporting ATPase subunit b
MTIDWWTLFLQTVNFLLLVWLLQHFLYKPVRAVIEKRRELAEEALDKAEAAEKAAAEAKAQFETKSAELDKAREVAMAAARQEAEAAAKTIIAKARSDADKIGAEARNEATATHAAALANLKQEIVDSAVEIAATILRKTTNSDLNEVFLSHLLAEIDALDKADRARIDADLATNGVEIATSMRLTKTERDAWTKKLREQLHFQGAPRFTTEPDLVGGAELRFAHANVRFAWSDHLRRAADILGEVRHKA